MKIGTLVGRASLLALALLAAVGGWLAWPRASALLLPRQGREAVSATVASPALAESTLDRVEGLRSGQSERKLALGGAELSSLMQYGLPGLLPPGVSDPAVRIERGALTLTARVARAAFPDFPGLDAVTAMLPDTVPVRIEGRLARFGKESLAFHVSHVEAARIPIPDRFIPSVLDAFGRQPGRGGVPPTALHIPLPGGLDSVYVLEDSLMLVAGIR